MNYFSVPKNMNDIFFVGFEVWKKKNDYHIFLSSAEIGADHVEVIQNKQLIWIYSFDVAQKKR